MVANTYTLNASFGSAIAVPGTGILLNNEMGDFAARPGKPNLFGLVQGETNSVEGGKRPLSSMSPTIVLRDGVPWLATGSPGGSRIITTVLQILLNVIAHDMNIAEATGVAPAFTTSGSRTSCGSRTGHQPGHHAAAGEDGDTR